MTIAGAEGIVVAGRYILLNRLGVGGMGEVWRAHDELTSDTVAVKVLRPAIAGAPAAELRFQREIEALSRLNHPRVVPILDAGADPRVGLFFVMRLEFGTPLHEKAEEWTHWQQLWPVLDQILETLGFAHAHGVIHRDIKPDNILVDDRDEVTLLDFGVARLKDYARSGTSAYDMLGTVDYAAPEQATGNRRRIGRWTDLYCLGIVLYELVCGKLPFYSHSPVQSLMMRLDRGCPKLAPRPGFVTPTGLWKVLDRMMRPQPFDRFLFAEEAREAFAELNLGDYEMQTRTSAAPPPRTPRQPERTSVTDSNVALLHQRTARYALMADGEGPSKQLQAPLRPPRVIGRDPLLLELSRGLERWRRHPRPGVLVLSGPEGCGKSRLVEELTLPFLASGQLEGHRHRWQPGTTVREVALGIVGAVGLPFQIARDHMHWWLEGHGLVDKRAREAIARWAVPDADEPAAAPIVDARRFAELLNATVRPRRPFILVLDGLQTLNTASLTIVHALRAHGVPAIAVLATRTNLLHHKDTPEWLRAATRTMGSLQDADVARILDDMVALDELDRQPIIYVADGNPRRLIEQLNALRIKGEIIPAWPRWLKATVVQPTS